MNTIKRILGILWIVAGPAAVIFMVYQALLKVAQAEEAVQRANSAAARALAAAARINVQLQWGIIIMIFVPIAFGLVIFGYYAIKGEYDRLPHSSVEL